MAGRVITVLHIVSMLALIAALGVIGLGVMVALSGIGATGLGAIALPAGTIVAVGGVIGLLPGLALRRAAIVLGETAPNLPPTTAGGRRVSTGVAALAAVVGIAPIAIWYQGVGTLNFAAASLLFVGAAAAVAAWAARYLLDRTLGVALLGLAIVGTGAAGWAATTIARDIGYRQAFEAEQSRREALYAPISTGPTAGELAALVPSAGSWRVVTGWVQPDLRPDEFPYGPRDVLAEFAGETVRFALVGQCWVDAPDGQLQARLWVVKAATAGSQPIERGELLLPMLACDGEVHVVTSDTVDIPASLDATAEYRYREEWLHASGSAVPVASLPGVGYADAASRWLLYIAVDPGTSLDDLQAAVSAHLPPLVLVPSS